MARKEESGAKRASRRVDDANLAKLVAEENASKNKFPQYPGLERWELLEKMGDGAFSNVYRARDLEGQYGQVAIKVVRKYEMNNMQVRPFGMIRDCCMFFLLSCCCPCFICTSLHSPPHYHEPYQPGGLCAFDRETIVCIQNLREGPRLPRCDTILHTPSLCLVFSFRPLILCSRSSIHLHSLTYTPYTHPVLLLSVLTHFSLARQYSERSSNYAPA